MNRYHFVKSDMKMLNTFEEMTTRVENCAANTY